MSVVRYGKKFAKKYPAARKRYRIYAPAVKQLASDVMYLKGLVNSEPKNLTTTFNNNVSYNGVVLSFCDLSMGGAANQRNGARVLPRYFGLHARIETTSTTTLVHLAYRAVLFRWWGESPNVLGISPTPAEILTGIGSQNAPDSFLINDIVGPKGDRQRRIEVLRNYYGIFDDSGTSSLCINENIEMNGGTKKEHMEYYDANAAPPTSGGIFLLICSESATGTDMQYHAVGRLTFYDN